MDPLDPNKNPEGYILHLEELLRDRHRIIKDLEWKLKEVDRCASIQEECATTFETLAERMATQNRELTTEIARLRYMIADWKFAPNGRSFAALGADNDDQSAEIIVPLLEQH